MDRLRAVVGQIVAFFRRGREEAELAEEIRHHIEMEVRANLGKGMSHREARRRALLAFGGTDWHAERVREERWGRALDDLRRDLHFGLRNLRRRLPFTVAAVLTLSLGIGMATTMFALVDAVLLRPLPGAHAGRMVYLELESDNGRMSTSPTPQLLQLVRDHATSFSRVEAYTSEVFDLIVDGEPVRATGARASVGFFSFLGVRPALGRVFLPQDGVGTADPVVILSHAMWVGRFGGSAAVLGRTIGIGDQLHEIIGVLPEDFRVDNPVEASLWIPERGDGTLLADGTPVDGALAELADGVSLEAARAELDAIIRNNPLNRMAGMGWVGRIYRPADVVAKSLKRAIVVLQGGALLVLLIGCGNLTNLLLAQGETRAREFALRASLGAGRGRLARQLLAESLLLSFLGCAGGIILTLWALGVLPVFLPAGYGGFAPNARIFLFATGVALASVLGVGLLPALKGARTELAECIRGGASPMGGRRSRIDVRRSLVTAEVATTVLLLVGAGLLLKSFAGLSRMDTGFDTRDLLTLRVELPEDRYPDDEARTAFSDRLRHEVEGGLPPALGRATLASGLVDDFAAAYTSLAPDGDDPGEDERLIVITWDVAPDYFDVTGVPILLGRSFRDSEGRGGEKVVVINEAVAGRYFPDIDPVGHRIRVGEQTYRVVGVAGALRLPVLVQNDVGDLQLFFPLGQEIGPALTLAARAEGNPSEVVERLKQAIWRIDPGLPLQDVATVDQLLADSLDQQRSNALLMVLFSATALLLGAVGIYGVVAYSVSRRRREMGIRLALGASATDVVSRVVVTGMMTAFAGMVLGAVGALLLGRTFSGLLHDVDPADPTVFLTVIVVTAGVSLLSTWLPARRATSPGPGEVLRAE